MLLLSALRFALELKPEFMLELPPAAPQPAGALPGAVAESLPAPSDSLAPPSLLLLLFVARFLRRTTRTTLRRRLGGAACVCGSTSPKDDCRERKGEREGSKGWCPTCHLVVLEAAMPLAAAAVELLESCLRVDCIASKAVATWVAAVQRVPHLPHLPPHLPLCVVLLLLA